jgi:hypothetical protein
MKRLLSVFAITLLAAPVFAQDDFGFGGTLSQSEIDQLLGGGGGGRGGRGRGNNVQSILPDPALMYNEIKELLKNKKVPLAKEQEKPLQTLLNDETKATRADLEKQYPALNPQNQQNQQNQQNNNQGRGGRGNPQNNQNNQNNQTARIDKVILDQNAALLTEMKPLLTAEQVAILDKAEKDKKCLVLIDGLYTFLNSGQRGNGNTNNRSWCTYGDFTANQRLAPVRDLLKRERKPLTTEQDAKLVALIEARVPVVERAFRDEGLINNNNRNNQNNQEQQRQQLANNIVNNIFQNLGIQQQNNNQGRGGNQNFNFEQVLQQACAPDATPEQRAAAEQQLSQGRGNFNRGGGDGNFNRGGGDANFNLQQLCQNFGNRGGRGGNNNNNVNFNVIRAEVEKRNEALLDKIAASLKPAQSSIIKRFKYDQIKSRGGTERIRSIMEEEGTPLTEQQITQIQALFNESNQTLRTWAQQLVLKQMETEPPPLQAQNQNQNQNRGNNNQGQQGQPNPLQQYQQTMRDKLMPRVAQERSRIENAMMNSVMKVLTPSQVASYKINMQMPPL